MPLDDGVVLAGPVAADEVDVAGVRLVQHGVVQDQDAGREIDLGLRLLPERLGVRLEAVQQAGEGVVGRRAGPGRLDAGGLDARWPPSGWRSGSRCSPRAGRAAGSYPPRYQPQPPCASGKAVNCVTPTRVLSDSANSL